jgi:hypothetical protein
MSGVRWLPWHADVGAYPVWHRVMCALLGHRPFQETYKMGYCLRCGQGYDGRIPALTVRIAPMYSRPECPLEDCADPDGCRSRERCQNVNVSEG